MNKLWFSIALSLLLLMVAALATCMGPEASTGDVKGSAVSTSIWHSTGAGD